MRYKVNPSVGVCSIDESTVLVDIDSNWKAFSANINAFYGLLDFFKKGNDLKYAYKKYEKVYERDEFETFIKTLIDEKILVEDDSFDDKFCIAFIGSRVYYDFFAELIPGNISLYFCHDAGDTLRKETKFIIFAPDVCTCQEALDMNRMLYRIGIPYIVFRFDGKNGILGPHIIPGETSCIECCMKQRLNVFRIKYEREVDISSLYSLPFAKHYESAPGEGWLSICFQTLLEEMAVSLNTADKQPNLINKEVFIDFSNAGSVKTNTYAPTSDCQTCNNINPQRHFIEKQHLDSVPVYTVPFSGKKIVYKTGGLRSVDRKQAKEILTGALSELDVTVKIELDETNPFADILPVYHSHLEKNYKSRTKIIFEEQLSHGKGMDREQAFLSAGYELVERISARYYGDVDLITGAYSDLKEYCMHVSPMVRTVENIKTVYDKFEDKKVIDWVWGYSIVEKRAKLVPASLVFLTDHCFWGNFPSAGSSGLSAGAHLEDAILQGLFEVLEHDAMMIGQCNQVYLPIIDYSDIRNERLAKTISAIREKGYEVISRDYTNDIGVPVIATWICDPANLKEYAMRGFGCSMDAELALERSVTEAIQSSPMYIDERTKDYTVPRMTNLNSNPNSLYSLAYFKQKDLGSFGKRVSIHSHDTNERYSTVQDVIQILIRKIKKVLPDADILYVNLTRPEINIPVVKVFITGGIQVLGDPALVICERMQEFQKRMGYGKETIPYEDLYLSDYPH